MCSPFASPQEKCAGGDGELVSIKTNKLDKEAKKTNKRATITVDGSSHGIVPPVPSSFNQLFLLLDSCLIKKEVSELESNYDSGTVGIRLWHMTGWSFDYPGQFVPAMFSHLCLFCVHARYVIVIIYSQWTTIQQERSLLLLLI